VKEKNEDKTERELIGKYMFRDMPLFKYEIVIYLVLLMVSVMLFIIERLIEVQGLAARVILPIAAIPLVIWFVKQFLYMPRKNRVPILKAYKSGVIELGVANIGKGYIEYGSGENKKRKFITKVAKHTEASTGKPFIITSEIHGENLNLVEKDKPDLRSEEFNAILETEKAVVTKSVMSRVLRFAQPSLQNPMFLILVVVLALQAVIVVKSFGFFGG